MLNKVKMTEWSSKGEKILEVTWRPFEGRRLPVPSCFCQSLQLPKAEVSVTMCMTDRNINQWPQRRICFWVAAENWSLLLYKTLSILLYHVFYYLSNTCTLENKNHLQYCKTMRNKQTKQWEFQLGQDNGIPGRLPFTKAWKHQVRGRPLRSTCLCIDRVTLTLRPSLGCLQRLDQVHKRLQNMQKKNCLEMPGISFLLP